jgi:hypothetical protein
MAIKAVVDSLDDVDEKYKDLYTQVGDKFEITGVEDVSGLSSVKALKTENGARRISERKAKEALAPFVAFLGDRKLEDVQAMLDRYPELEAAAEGKLDEAKINGIVEGRIKTKLAPVERERDQLKGQITERDKQIEGFTAKERTRTIHDAVREAVGKQQGFQASAIEDVLIQAERMFEITEDGKVITKQDLGVTPGIDAVVWLTEMQVKRPHWWGTTSGGGSRGNNGSNQTPSGNNPFTREHWNMTEQAGLIKTNRSRAEQMAKSAGTKIGGGMPAPARK